MARRAHGHGALAMPLPISRTMNWPDDIVPPEVLAFLELLKSQGHEQIGQLAAQGGGNLNGSQNTANLLGQSGTPCSRIGLPRANKGNYCGIV